MADELAAGVVALGDEALVEAYSTARLGLASERAEPAPASAGPAPRYDQPSRRPPPRSGKTRPYRRQRPAIPVRIEAGSPQRPRQSGISAYDGNLNRSIQPSSCGLPAKRSGKPAPFVTPDPRPGAHDERSSRLRLPPASRPESAVGVAIGRCARSRSVIASGLGRSSWVAGRQAFGVCFPGSMKGTGTTVAGRSPPASVSTRSWVPGSASSAGTQA